jgi:hypothetical protein
VCVGGGQQRCRTTCGGISDVYIIRWAKQCNCECRTQPVLKLDLVMPPDVYQMPLHDSAVHWHWQCNT